MKNHKRNAQEMYSFCSQLGLILKSGLPLYESLESIAAHDEEHGYIMQIAQDMANGSSFYDALLNSDCFDDPFLDMVKVGEASGCLDQVMEANAAYYQRMDQTNAKIKQLLLYPILLGTLLLAVMAVILLFILPIFQNLLQQVNHSLPTLALTMMNIAHNIGLLGFFLLIVFLLGLAFWYMHKKENRLQYQFPFMKDLQYQLGISQMTYALSLLISSGYHLEDTLKLVQHMTEDTSVYRKLEQCQKDIQNGMTLEEALMHNHLYEGISEKILYAGCKSGYAETALRQLAKLQEENVNETINRRLNALEPAMVAIISIFTAIMMMSVMLPVISLLSNIG